MIEKYLVLLFVIFLILQLVNVCFFACGVVLSILPYNEKQKPRYIFI